MRTAAVLFVAVALLVPARPGLLAVEVRKIRPGQPDDRTLVREVRQRLTGRLRLNLRGIVIDVQEGHLILSGRVPSLYDAMEAERLSAAIRGLRSITNRIDVESTEIPDSLLELHAMRSLEASPRLRSFRLQVSVKDAVLNLSGEVPLARDRLEAEKLVSRVEGIREMKNGIQVAHKPVDPQIISRRLEGVLGRKMIFGGVDELEVSVSEEGRVTLKGIAAAHVDRLQAERIAYGIPGVTSVDNLIVVRRAPDPRP